MSVRASTQQSNKRPKPINPYTTLTRVVREWGSKVICPRVRLMWRYEKKSLDGPWELKTLWERTMAAQQIGYEVRLVANDEGLRVEYVEKRPDSLPMGV